MAIAYAESQDPSNLPLAKEMLEYLSQAYPNHSWWVRIDGGLVIIKNFAISGTIGMVRRFDQISHDSKVRKHDILMAAGELLERAKMRRGGFDGQSAKTLDGGEEFKWQPLPYDIPVIH